jgi:hypothetical protein
MLGGALTLAAERWFSGANSVLIAPSPHAQGPCGAGSAGVPETVEGRAMPSPRGPAFSC